MNAEVKIPSDDSIEYTRELADGNFINEIAGSEHKEFLLAALKDLPQEQVNLLDMSFFQGYSHAEISEMLQMPLGTVKSKIRNALLELRKVLAFMQGDFA